MTEVQDEDIDALTSLGLTMLQATVYLTLVESGNSTIKDIAKTAGVARQDLYRITSELQKRGLVEQIITKPITYKAIPLKNGVNVLLDELQRKRIEAQTEATELIKRYKNKEDTTKNETEENQCLLVTGKNAVITKEKNMFDNAQKNIKIITSNKRFTQRLYFFADEPKNTTAEKLKMRVIMDKDEPENYQDLIDEVLKSYKGKISFEAKYIPKPPPTVMAVIDKKEVIIVASPNKALTESPALWSNNPSLVEIAHGYFEMMWQKAHKNPKPKQNHNHPKTPHTH